MLTKEKKSKNKYLLFLIILIGIFIIVHYLFFQGKRAISFADSEKTILLDDDGLSVKMKTTSANVAEFLTSQQIVLNEQDLVFPEQSSPIFPNSIIKIQRAKKIKVFVDKETKNLFGFANTIGEIIAENNLNIKEEDIIKPERNTFAYNNIEIKITRVEIKEEIVKKDIEFKTVEKEDAKLSWRTKKIETAGTKGIKEIKYEVAYYDGKEVSRKIKESTVIQEPSDKVIIQGTFVKLGASHTGKASWYAYTGTMSAANPWLPMGSFVKVTNKDNGKSVIVKINDRGPFGAGRIIDLDKVAFEKIAPLGQGMANIKMEEITN